MIDNIRHPHSNIYFLIGFMGSGKSLLSKGIRSVMDVEAIDMDAEIEKSAGAPINLIFETEGEDYFRHLEREQLHSLIREYTNSDKIVLIGTGGGVPCHFDNMEVMNQSGTTVFINPSIERLCSRLESKKDDRPLIRHRSAAEIREYVELTMAQRLPCYMQAGIHINLIYDDKTRNIGFLKEVLFP